MLIINGLTIRVYSFQRLYTWWLKIEQPNAWISYGVWLIISTKCVVTIGFSPGSEWRWRPCSSRQIPGFRWLKPGGAPAGTALVLRQHNPGITERKNTWFSLEFRRPSNFWPYFRFFLDFLGVSPKMRRFFAFFWDFEQNFEVFLLILIFASLERTRRRTRAHARSRWPHPCAERG